ncbi:hypothetical protein LCGC14_2455290 [marine sediment metagenome]|uniref:Glycosyltransferase 2-like domain-containing protein n=1 Tax=marine sediment metagenome TaxID=412755 RepID=A0A0F9BEU3_9ZZZZ
MTISLVINTCAGGPKAAETLSSGRQSHMQRSFALRNFILPAALADPTFSQVIVVGEWEPGNGYIYIEVLSERFSCVDALAQRQAGFERSTGDWVVFQHDDHSMNNYVWDVTHSLLQWIHLTEADVLVPARYTRLRNVNGEKLYNGESTSDLPGYISGHCAIYRREVLERCPWGDVKRSWTWDISHTKQIRDAGFKIEWSSALTVWDCEMDSKPWS